MNFMIVEEDKDAGISTEILFEMLDLDGDGVLSPADLYVFWFYMEKM